MSSLVGEKLARYAIVEQLGAGGMGIVYRAHDERLQRDVALKILPPNAVADDNARRRFQREALYLAQLSHGNIAAIYDFDSVGGVDFLVMEYVSGVPLNLSTRGQFSDAELADFGMQLADGLTAAHDRGVVHRDIKPANLILTSAGHLKILDFGIARLKATPERADVDETTATHGISGTPPYMAPEQLRDEDLDPRTDIWAAGAVLYELATGERPFRAPTGASLADAILNQNPEPPRVRNRALSLALEAVIMKCLQKDRAARYQSAGELAADFRRILSGSPTRAEGLVIQKLGDILSERAIADFAGREREIAALLGLFEKGGPLVLHVHGVAGIGKSSLLEAFGARALVRGAHVVRIDCRAVEPTARGFLSELSEALGERLSTVEAAAQRLSSFGEMVVIALDTYEVFVLLDTWIRQVFVPSLPTNARVAIGSRNPPSPVWRTAAGWQGLFRSLLLEPLSEAESLGYLATSGIPPDVARRINSVARGHPLALSMSASIVLSDPGRTIEETGLHQVIDALSRSYIEAVPDAITRRALEASSVVRCVTEPLLHALLPGTAPGDNMERLVALPFVVPGREGLFIHDAVRSAIASSVAARDPDTHRQYRRAAWAYLQNRLRLARGTEPWRYTADLLFLMENPVLREGFFPSGPHPLAVEPATAGDEAAVRRIVAEKAAPELEALSAWWRYHPDGFHIVRDREGSVSGFSIRVLGSELHEGVVDADAVAAAWRRDAAARDPSATLFIRRWLDREVGEAPSPTQAALWVDAKRTYVEMRGTLRWVYSAMTNPEPFAEVATKLGFRPLANPTAEVGGQTIYSFLLDMGPGSVDAWLTEMVGAEITADEIRSSKVLDVEDRELILTSGRAGLTSLESGVLQYLQERPGKAVSRYDLMEAVWGYRNPTASNVVDVVVRSLRRKLGVEASAVETVRGTGYRYRIQAPTA